MHAHQHRALRGQGHPERMVTVQTGARGPQTDLMESYVKEQRHDDAERDPEM